MLAEINCITAGSGIQVTAPYGGQQASTVEEFRARPIGVGNYVLTAADVQTHFFERECAKLARMKIWIWKVIHIYGPGSRLPPNISSVAGRDEITFECHLHVPDTGISWTSPIRPVWDLQSKTRFIATPQEAAAAQATSFGETGRELRVPLTALLRRNNILGGGFHLTSTHRVPPVVKQFLAPQK